MERGQNLREERARGNLPGMGTAKRLLKVGMSNAHLEVVCHS